MAYLRYLIAAVAAAAAATATAQAPLSPAEHQRTAAEMLRDANPVGAFDQLTGVSVADPAQDALNEDELFDLAKATLLTHDFNGAKQLFTNFLARYPYSLKRNDARCYVADCEYTCGRYPEALKLYALVDSDQLPAERCAEYWFRQGYSYMKLADYDKAMQCFDKVTDSPDMEIVVAATFYKGYISFIQGDYAQAKRYLSSASEAYGPAKFRDYYLSQIYFLEGDYDKATSGAKKAIRAGLGEEFMPEMNRILGESAYLTDHTGSGLQNAITYLKKYVGAVEEPQPSSLYILGLSYYESGQYGKAIEALQPVAEANDAMGQSACLYLGQAYLKDDNLDGALAAFDRALRAEFDTDVQEAAFYNYAVARSNGGQLPFNSSVSTFEEFLSRFPNSRYAPEVQKYLVAGYMTDGNYAEALASINRMSRPSKEILAAKQQVLYNLGAANLASGDTDNAISYLTQALELGSHNGALEAETHLLLGDCYSRNGQYAKAAGQFQDYLNKAGADATNRSLAFYDLGYAHFAQKKYAEAADDYAKAVANSSKLPSTLVADAWNRIGDCRYNEHRYAAADEAYNKAYKTSTATGDYSLFQRAMMQGLSGDKQAKVNTLDLLTTDFPGSSLIPEALLEKAQTLVALDRMPKAIEAYNVLIDTYPATAQGRNAALQLANAYASSGNVNDAINTYMGVIADYPTSDEAQIASEMLKNLMAKENRLDEYLSFLEETPDAPRLEAGEADTLTFDAAVSNYRSTGDTERLQAYLASYPQGQGVAEALHILVADADSNGDSDKVIDYGRTLLERYPDSSHTQDILPMKGEAELSAGMAVAALDTYRHMLSRAADAADATEARWGILRAARELALWDEVEQQAQTLIDNGANGQAEKAEAIFSRGLALQQKGDTKAAIADWKAIAKQGNDLYGAKAAVYLAEQLYNNGDLDGATDVLSNFINNGTPYNYWLARAYIVFSDVLRAQGDNFTAREFLQQLRANYPGDEPEIIEAIDSRL